MTVGVTGAQGFHDNLEGNVFIAEHPLSEWNQWLPTVMGMQAMGQKTAPAWICTSKLKRSKPSQYRAQFERLASLVKPEAVPGIKITVTSPFWQHLRYGKKSYEGVYANDDEVRRSARALSRALELRTVFCRHPKVLPRGAKGVIRCRMPWVSSPFAGVSSAQRAGNIQIDE